MIACAQQQPLTGGEKDEDPPKIDKSLSTPNNQTNFEKQTIEFFFDEYIKLENALKLVVISPPLDRIPTITTKLKKLQFKFAEEEVLKEDATYSISFGDAVKDLTEGNPVPNFKFIFSTGDFIDSLKMEGMIVDALTGEPVKDVLYMLYKNLADSVVQTEKPFYFGKSDQTGNFLIENIKAGEYKAFALEDQDLNYLYNIPTERIGFSMDTLLITDSTTTKIEAAIFEPYALVLKPKANVKQYGLVTLAFKRPPFDATIELEDVGQTSFIETVEDTIKVWYHTPDSIDWNILVHRDTITDTIGVKALAQNLAQKKLSLPQKRRAKKGAVGTQLNPMKPIKLTFNHPIVEIDTSLIFFREDSIQEIEEIELEELEVIDTFNLPVDSSIVEATPDTVMDTLNLSVDSSLVEATPDTAIYISPTFEIDSTNQRTLLINYPWKETLQYELQILPGAIKDLYNLENIDTLNKTYLVKEQKDFGIIQLMASEMDSLQQYHFELLFNNNVVLDFDVAGMTTYERKFESLPPGKYTIKVIEDLNKNGRWDSGDYYKKLQPERISTAELEELKANWEIKAEVKVKF